MTKTKWTKWAKQTKTPPVRILWICREMHQNHSANRNTTMSMMWVEGTRHKQYNGKKQKRREGSMERRAPFLWHLSVWRNVGRLGTKGEILWGSAAISGVKICPFQCTLRRGGVTARFKVRIGCPAWIWKEFNQTNSKCVPTGYIN